MMAGNKDLNKNIVLHRWFAIIYLIAAIAVLVCIYLNLIGLERGILMFLWGWMSGLLGFSIYIFHKISLLKKGGVTNESPLPSYLYYYPFLLAMSSLFIMFVLLFILPIDEGRFPLGLFSIQVFLGLNVDLARYFPIICMQKKLKDV